MSSLDSVSELSDLSEGYEPDELESDQISDSEQITSVMSSLDSYSKPKQMSYSELISYMSNTLDLSAYSKLQEPDELESKLIFYITRIVSVVSHRVCRKSWGISKSLSEFIYLSTQLISIVSSMDLDSQPESELISLIKKIVDFGNSVSSGWGPESQVVSLVTQMIYLSRSIESDPEPEIVPLVAQIFYHLDSMNSNSELLSLITQIFFLAHRILTELNLKVKPSIIEVLSCRQSTYWDAKFLSYMTIIISRFKSHLSPESRLMSLITQISFGKSLWLWNGFYGRFDTLMTEIISLISSMDLDSQPKPETEFISLIKQIKSLVNSTNLDSQQNPDLKVMSFIKQLFSPTDPELIDSLKFELKSLMSELKSLMRSQHYSLINYINELKSLFCQIFSLGVSMDPNLKRRKSLCPQAQVSFEKDNFHVIEGKFSWSSNNKWKCLPFYWKFFSFSGDEDFTLPGDEDFYFPSDEEYESKFIAHFYCLTCNGENHKEYNQVLVEIKHPLHPKHYLQIVRVDTDFKTRVCYCCDANLMKIFYYCSSCDLAMNIGCVEKPPILSIDHSKWHEQHSLTLFPRVTALNCNVCALTHSSCPFYMCPPCDFVVHQKCLSLPRVIKISRHRHRIYFTPSFDRGDRYCGICRTKINNDYGGYSCIKNQCFYVAHTRCGTQSNVWDGKDLEGVPEEVEEEELPPFETRTDGSIEHFCHPTHYLRLDQNTSRDFDEYKLCEACVMPIYFGNIYSCMECDFILHEKCANYPRKIDHPIHPHVLTLINYELYIPDKCSACSSRCTAGYFYKCRNEECNFVVHVGCGTISEPLEHPSHNHPLFLTSKPEEARRICSVCKNSRDCSSDETFNCVEECDFALCYDCATLPQKVRYKHDEHVLTLSYGENTSTMTYWCESCEGKIDPKKRFYRCDEYCCVTLHIDCMLGADLYMEHNSYWVSRMDVLTKPNNHMSRPVCIRCRKRCPHKVFIKRERNIYCSSFCFSP